MADATSESVNAPAGATTEPGGPKVAATFTPRSRFLDLVNFVLPMIDGLGWNAFNNCEVFRAAERLAALAFALGFRHPPFRFYTTTERIKQETDYGIPWWCRETLPTCRDRTHIVVNKPYMTDICDVILPDSLAPAGCCGQSAAAEPCLPTHCRAYWALEEWRKAVEAIQEQAEIIAAPEPTNGFFSAADLADRHCIPREKREALRKRLERWRSRGVLGTDWMEHDAPGRGEDRYLYRESAVYGIIHDE